MIAILFKIVGYLGWLITTALGIGGSWFWNFTETDPNDVDRKRLTRAGRRAVYVMVISVTCAVVSTTYNEMRSYNSAKTAAQEKRHQQESLKSLQQQNRELNVTVHQLLSRHGLLELATGDRSLAQLFSQFEPFIPGRENERRRLSEMAERPIHFGSMGLMATFTLRDFGRTAPERLTQMACIISLMEADVVWIQELRDSDQLRVLKRLLPQYDIRWGNVGLRQGTYGTGLAMLYRRATVTVLDEPTFLPAWNRSKESEEYTWYRVPFAQTIRLGQLTIQIVNVKLYFGSNSGPKLERRRAELDSLIKWIERRMSDDPLIIAGEFYWDTKHEQMQKFSDLGFFLPSALLPPEATEWVHRDAVRRYSHFVVSKELKKHYISGSIRYQPIRPLFPDLPIKELLKVVDHKPLLMAIRID